MCFCLGLSIILPFWLSSLRLSLTCPGISLGIKDGGMKKKILTYFLDIMILWPYHPIFLSIQVAYLELKKESILEHKDVDGDSFSRISEKHKDLMKHLHMYKKMELNLEAIFQMSGKLVLLLFIWSETR